jgi:hypothetical protein
MVEQEAALKQKKLILEEKKYKYDEVSYLSLET